jgi:hypothetical protein
MEKAEFLVAVAFDLECLETEFPRTFFSLCISQDHQDVVRAILVAGIEAIRFCLNRSSFFLLGASVEGEGHAGEGERKASWISHFISPSLVVTE